MRFFLINLDRDSDRLAYMTQSLGEHGFVAERIPAFLGLDIPDDLKPFFLTADGGIDSAMNKGEIGCYASHMFAIGRLVKEDIREPVCIMEDDLRLSSNFHQITRMLEDAPEDWEIIRISNPSKAAYDRIRDVEDLGQFVRYWRIPNTAGAYIINQTGARKFIDYQKLRKRPIDEDMRRPWEHGLVTYGILPSPAINNIFESTIDEVGGDRSLPARKRFRDAGGSVLSEWRYRFGLFGLAGSASAILRTLLFRKRYR